MKPATYFRKGRVIRGPNGDEVFKSINAAKRASRKIQGGSMGNGTLRVVDKFPK